MNIDRINDLYKKFIVDGTNIALDNCTGGYPDEKDCLWYHKNWMLLRYLGIVSNPYWHEEFYINALKQFVQNESQLLVVGTADFSMPLLCFESGFKNISICDICNTPLKICDLVSQCLKIKWNTFKHDVCSEITTKYDVVINDAFLSRFRDKTSPLYGIAQSLKTEGYYITTLKLGEINRGGEISEKIKKQFLQKVEKRYREKADNLPKLNIEQVANEYLRKMASFPVRNEKEVNELFDSVGLDIVHIERGIVEGEYMPTEYFRIISKK